MVSMLCRLYKEPDASQFSLSYMPLIYYYVDEGFSFNWDDILSSNLENDIATVVEAQSRNLPKFPHVFLPLGNHVHCTPIPKDGMEMETIR
jgi:hypothetical protein